MRTNIVLDDRLIAAAMKLTKARSKREAVDLALRELVTRRRRKNVLELIGQDLIAPDYDVRAVRGESLSVCIRSYTFIIYPDD